MAIAIVQYFNTRVTSTYVLAHIGMSTLVLVDRSGMGTFSDQCFVCNELSTLFVNNFVYCDYMY